MMQITISKKPRKPAIRNEFRRQTELHTMMLPGTVMMIVFNIIPLFGLIIAFTNFKATMGWEGIFTSQWNNFRNFRQVFSSSQFDPMIRNTLGINLLGQFISIPIAILFALLLNEIRSPRRKSFVQTAAYLPHFLSWAIFGGLIKNLLSADGAMNQLLMGMHIISQPKEWMADAGLLLDHMYCFRPDQGSGLERHHLPGRHFGGGSHTV